MPNAVYYPDLCGPDEPFWDANLTWYTETPSVPNCLQKTALLWLPCLLLFLVGVPSLLCTAASPRKSRTLPTSSIFVARAVLHLLLLVPVVVEYFLVPSPSPADLQFVIVFPLALVFSLVLLYRDWGVGRANSGLKFFFWTLLTVLFAPFFAGSVESLGSGLDAGLPACRIVIYALILLLEATQFVSADLNRSFSQVGAPYPSKLTFNWLNRLFPRGADYKAGPISQEDFPRLTDNIQVEGINERFFSRLDKRKSVNVLPVLVGSFWNVILDSAVWQLCEVLGIFFNVQALRWFIRSLQDADSLAWHK